MFAHFNNHQFRRYLVAFGSLFSNIVVTREDTTGAEVQRLVVPLEYGPKDKWFLRLSQDPSFLQGVSQILPRMAYEVSSVAYDGSRKLNTMNQLTFPTDDLRKRAQTYVGVPYTLAFQLDILTKLQQDGFQIVEQILPYFTPDLVFAVNVVPELGLIDQIPLTLVNVSHSDNYEGDFMKRRAVIWSLDFRMKVNFYGARRKQSRIEEVMVDIRNFPIPGLDPEVIITEQQNDIFTSEAGEPIVSEATADVFTGADYLAAIDVTLNPLDQLVSDNPTVTTTITEGADDVAILYSDLILDVSPSAYWRLGDTDIGPFDEIRANTTQQPTRLYANVALGADGVTQSQDGNKSVLFNSTSLVKTGYKSGLSQTIEAWVYPLSQTGNQTIYSSENSLGRGGWFGTVSGALVYRYVSVSDVATQVSTQADNILIPTNVWTHVAMTTTSDGATTILYINGVAVRVGAVAWQSIAQFQTIGSTLSTGGPSFLGTGFDGRIDELAIYNNTLLLPASIFTHYHIGAALLS